MHCGRRRACVLFIADSITFASPEHPILVVDLDDKILSVAEFPDIADRAPFRCIPSEFWGVENNLSISNMDWDDFASEVGDDGVFALAPSRTEINRRFLLGWVWRGERCGR